MRRGKRLHRLIVIGHKGMGFRGLERILNSREVGALFEVVGVITTKPSTDPSQLVRKVALAKGLPVFDGNVDSTEALDWVRALRPDFGAMMQYNQKLTAEFIGLFSRYIVNAHPSDLPRSRGGIPLQTEIARGEPMVITIHRVTPSFDAGAWLLKTHGEDIGGLDSEAVYPLCVSRAAEAMEKALVRIGTGRARFTGQEAGGQATYMWLRDLGELLTIHWTQDDLEAIYRKVLAGGARAFLGLDGEPIGVRITGAFRRVSAHGREPGDVVSARDGVYEVACVGGFLHVYDFADTSLARDTPEYARARAALEACGEKTVAFVSPLPGVS